VIGQETGVLYQYETSTGIKWKTFGNEKVQPKYEGEIKNGDMWFILHGLGVITFPYDGKSVVGEWKNGKEWNTKHTKRDGTLIGKFVGGEWELMWGVMYLGLRKWKVGYYKEKWEGEESEDNKDSGKYEGEIQNGLPNGQGTSIDTDGRKYVGSWKNGKWNGKGTTTSPSGSKYEGNWKDGYLWNGIQYENGIIYYKWVNGK